MGMHLIGNSLTAFLVHFSLDPNDSGNTLVIGIRAGTTDKEVERRNWTLDVGASKVRDNSDVVSSQVFNSKVDSFATCYYKCLARIRSLLQ